jgi:probable F420-dependent oxidoreductase
LEPDGDPPASQRANIRKFRFIGQVSKALDPRQLADEARAAEALGYSVVVISDHLVPQLGALAALTAIATATNLIRLGPFVLNNDLRHPVVLAQELASIDLLSRGRLEIGIGAGWNQAEYVTTGIPFDPPAVRIERLRESIAVLDGCFADGSFSAVGRHYQVTEHDGQPKPLQRPRPPLLVAGGGHRILTLAGQTADIIGLAPVPPAPGSAQRFDASEAAVRRQVNWLREATGSRWATVEINIHPALAPVTLTDRPRQEAATILGRLQGRYGNLEPDELLASPFSLIGSVDQITEKIQRLRDLFGISSYHLGPVGTLANVIARLAGT